MSIKDWPVNERPREKLLANGADSLSDAELLAVLLGGSGRRGLDAVAMARGLLSRHQSLRGLLSAQRQHSQCVPGLGSVGYCRLQAAVELARCHYAAVILAHNHPLCCGTGVTTGSGVIGSGSGGQFGEGNAR